MVTIVGRMTSKGQITVPSEVRRTLGLDTGSPVAFHIADDGTITLRSPVKELEAVLGTLPPLSVSVEEAIRIAREEMEQDAVERHLRVLDT